MSEIKLQQRYPNSRHEDITDAFMRGYVSAVETSMKLLKEQVAENAKLRKELELCIGGTCCNVAGMEDAFECSVCGGRYVSWELRRWARYCPDCGRKVVDS